MEEYSKKFMLDYNFPPSSVGEVKPMRGPGRREIGHGMLAERSLKARLLQRLAGGGGEGLLAFLGLAGDRMESAAAPGGTLEQEDLGAPLAGP